MSNGNLPAPEAAAELTAPIRHTFVESISRRLPIICTVIILAMVVIIVLNFLITGAPALSWEFLTEAPRKANTEGGILPAIIGTFFLVLLMTVAAVPVGTITAIYLTEYARQNSILARIIRFAVNTLAGVPSVVFGLFGLGFFIMTIGRGVDRVDWDRRMHVLRDALAAPTSPVAGNRIATISDVQKYLFALRNDDWSGEVKKLQSYPRGVSGPTTAELTVKYLDRTPELHWGKPGLLWAALTLALLTMPVVIVSVEEALRNVPREIRDASIALGATRWETIRKVVLPNSVTGILTGSILAVSRGAGEVAPILFTGVIYSAQSGPGSLTDQFMHLGYHLYLLATQSPDVDGTAPLQYATTIVLLGLTLLLNISAILLRSRLQRRRIVL